MPRVAAVVLAALLAVASGAGVYFWQSRQLEPLRADLQVASDKVKTAETKLMTAETNLRQAEEDIKSAVQAQTELLRKVKGLEDALRIDTSESDVATAYGKARVTRNDDWMLALMTPEARAKFTPFPSTSNPKPNRFEILSGDGDTWVVRVFEHQTGEGELGYTDSTLIIRKLNDGFFWITDHKVGPFVSLRGSSK